jgi:hypothetical protein
MIPTDPVEIFRRSEAALGERFALERLVAASAERVLLLASDRVLKRRVSLRINFWSNAATRAWFLGEAVALGRLDHPAIRHVYDVGVIDDLAYRVGNWTRRWVAPPAPFHRSTRSRATCSAPSSTRTDKE